MRASTRHPVVWDPLVGFDRARNVGEVPTGGLRLTVSQTPDFPATHVCGLPVGPPGHHPSLRHANPNELRRSRVISSPISLAADSGSPELLGISSAHAAPFFPPTLRLFRNHGDRSQLPERPLGAATARFHIYHRRRLTDRPRNFAPSSGACL